MAGDWIKVEKATARKPEVLRIADALGIHPDHAFGLCFRFWSWCDDQLADGNALGVTESLVDALVERSGFGSALVTVGWLRVRAGANSLTPSSLEVPNFDRHLSESAKKRALTASRVAKHKSGKGNAASVTGALPREEKRREETHPPLACVFPVTPAREAETPAEQAERPPDGPIGDAASEAAFLAIWNTLPTGKRGVVRVSGLPPILSPRDRQLVREFWPVKRDDAVKAMAALAAGAIGWDRDPLTIRQFFENGEIDKILGGGHAKRTRVSEQRARPAGRVDGAADLANRPVAVSADEYLARSGAVPR